MEMDTNPIRAVLSIPIYPKDHYYDTVNQDASASIVFASKKIVNHFDDESFVDLQRCLPILTLFVEDYLLKKMASEDRLTKVLSRRELESEMIYHLSRARDQKSDLAIMILDIDNFKKINDTFGHLTGDAVLQELSAVMKHSLEPNMKIGRYGGEEFIVIMPDKTSQEAFEFAELLRNVLNEHDYASVGDFPITISIGVSTFQKEQDSLSSMIERADEALYKAKKSGKNQSVLWSRELEIKKSESDLAKQMIHENHYKNSRYRLSFVEMISELSGFCSKEEGLYRVLTKMLEALEAREVVVYLTNRKDRNVLSLKRKQTQVEYSAQADLDLVKEIKRHANGFYRNDWSSGSYLNEVTGLIEWSSVLGFEMIDREEAVACVYFKSNLREREFNKQDLRFATVFSTFLLGYLQDNESE